MSTTLITLLPEIVENLIQEIQQASGAEICGYLLLEDTNHQQFFKLQNHSRDMNGFVVTKSEYRRCMRYISRHKLRIIAFIHSHYSSLELSQMDRMFLNNDDVPWIVVMLTEVGLVSAVYESNI